MTDPAFENAGAEKGLEIWRIEDFQVVPYPKEKYGKFHQGDSYIVLNTEETRSGSLVWDIYFWLGSQTSQDESGAAAIKSVELDDQLGGGPVQHREVEAHESASFLSRFKNGIRYLKGGVASGFEHVDPDAPYDNKLFKVKGRRNVRVSQIDVSLSLMNKSDCFILDAGATIYVFCGPQSRRMERMKAILTANNIRDEDHAGGSTIKILDESCDSGELEEFFACMGGGSLDDIPDEEPVEDEEYERTAQNVVSLHHVWEDDSSQIQQEKVGEKLLNQNMLKSGDCYILDTGSSGVFVWIGRESSRKEKVRSMEMAKNYLTEKGSPSWTKVERVIERGEPTAFKQYFKTWQEDEDQIGLGRKFTIEQVAASFPEEVEFKVSSMHRSKRLARNVGPAFGFLPDDGSGQVEIHRVENFELVPVDENQNGFFFGGDSYVLKYTYEADNIERYIVYFWQGNSSSQDEKASSAIHAVRIDNELCGKAIQVRVCQGQEPEHFLRIFKGKMVVFSGGKASGFNNVHDHDTYDVDGTRLFRIRGVCEIDTRAVQISEVAASLSSGDVFLLETPTVTYLWIGNGASDDEKSMAESVVPRLSPDREIVHVTEGAEPDHFWASLGGKGDYDTSENGNNPSLEARVFHCTIKENGKVRVQQVDSFSQQDLIEDDVMIVDSGDEVYVWVGKDASEAEKTSGIEIANEYLATDPTGRSLEKNVIVRVNQGNEPSSLISLFPEWNPNMWQELESYEELKARIASQE